MLNRRSAVGALIAILAVAGGGGSQARNETSTFSDIVTRTAEYIDWRRRGSNAAEAPLHAADVWNGRFHSGDTLHMLGRADASEMPAMPDEPRITLVQSFHDDFAIARIDDWRAPATLLLTLFRTSEGWRVATEAMAPADCVSRAAQYSPDIAARPVLEALGVYYSAVERENADALDSVFHQHWRMKNHENDVAVSEGQNIFATRLTGNQHTGYTDDRQIADVQVIYDCMAFVRIDKPSSTGVTVFTFYRSGDAWRIVDKAWTSPK